MTDISISLVGPDQRLAIGAVGRAQAAQLAAAASAQQASDALAAAQAARDQAIAYRQRVDLYMVLGQSLTIGHAPQVTQAGAVVPTLSTFNGGSEAPAVTSPAPLNISAYPIDPNNMASIVPFSPIAGYEGWGPGLGYQSQKAGVPACFFFAPGTGSMSIKALHFAHVVNLQHGLIRAVKLLRAAGYEPIVHLVFEQGHADADLTGDTASAISASTTTAQYLLAAQKLFATMRFSATLALGYSFTGPIWVVPLLTQNSVASVDSRRAISDAQAQMPGLIPGVKLLPPRSQFANLFATDLTHPVGQGYRYYAETVDAAIRSGQTPPRMLSKALSGSTVVVTFDQAIKVGSVPEMAVPGNSKGGYTIVDNTGAEVAITALAYGANTVSLTPATTANLSGTWYVRNGLQNTNPVANQTGQPTSYMPRTMTVAATDIGTAQDGTVLQLSSIVQEI